MSSFSKQVRHCERGSRCLLAHGAESAQACSRSLFKFVFALIHLKSFKSNLWAGYCLLHVQKWRAAGMFFACVRSYGMPEQDVPGNISVAEACCPVPVLRPYTNLHCSWELPLVIIQMNLYIFTFVYFIATSCRIGHCVMASCWFVLLSKSGL